MDPVSAAIPSYPWSIFVATPNRSFWVPDGDGGFVEGLLESENGGKVQVSIGHEKKVFKKEQIQQVIKSLETY